jgi:hypothetical protein
MDRYKNIYYMNIMELRSLCDKHEIPYVIYEQTGTGIKKTSVIDRKEVMVKKILNKIKVYRQLYL